MRTLVAVIAYNEEKSIGATLEDLASSGLGYDVVVVDNASTDETVARCREAGVEVLSHCVNTGSSFGTVMTYFRYADRMGYDILCQFDGDGQHLARELPKIIAPITRGEADYVIGSRYIEKEGFQSGRLRKIGIRMFSALDSLITGQRITDATSGFRAYNRKVIRLFSRYYRHEIHDTSQLLLLSHFAGARIKEVPIIMKERLHGVSEYSFFSGFSFPLKGLVNIMGCLLQRGQMRNLVRDDRGN